MVRHKTATEWFELVDAWENSQQRAAEWCRDQGIGYQSFLHWRRRREAERRELPLSAGRGFCEVLPQSAPVLTAEVNGVRILMERGFDPELLREVIAALRGA